MNQTFLIGISTAFLLTACFHSNENAVKDFVSTKNKFDKEEVGKLLDEHFISVDAKGNKKNKTAYLNQFDSLKTFEITSNIISSQDFDSIIKTDEQDVSIVDSILGVTPKMLQRKTYKLKDGKISSISVDSILNFDDYNKSYKEKLQPFAFWFEDTHDMDEQLLILKNLKKYLSDYSQLSVTEKKNYKTYSQLQGTYISNNSLYSKLIFKGKKTVTVVDAFIGFPFSSSYEIDEQYIRISTDKSDLLFKIKDSKTLIGEGFADGIYIKSNEQ